MVGHLLKANPGFDIRLAQLDPCISKLEDAKLREFLTPRLLYQEQHGLMFNHLTIANHSAFRVTAVTVTVRVQRRDGTTDPPVVRQVASLDAGGEHRWSNFFKHVALFGTNIKKVDVTLGCAEAEPTFVEVRPPSPPRPVTDTRRRADTVAGRGAADKKRQEEENIPWVEAAEESPKAAKDIPRLKGAKEVPPAPGEVPVLELADEIPGERRANPKATVCPFCGFTGKPGLQKCPRCHSIVPRKPRRP